MGITISSGLVNLPSTTTINTIAAFPAPAVTQTIINLASAKAGQAITAGTPYTAYTVTGGKKFYATAIHIGSGAVSGNLLEVLDNATPKASIYCSTALATTTASGISTSFPTPLEFSTSVKIDVGTTATVWYTISGFEQ